MTHLDVGCRVAAPQHVQQLPLVVHAFIVRGRPPPETLPPERRPRRRRRRKVEQVAGGGGGGASTLPSSQRKRSLTSSAQAAHPAPFQVDALRPPRGVRRPVCGAREGWRKVLENGCPAPDRVIETHAIEFRCFSGHQMPTSPPCHRCGGFHTLCLSSGGLLLQASNPVGCPVMQDTGHVQGAPPQQQPLQVQTRERRQQGRWSLCRVVGCAGFPTAPAPRLRPPPRLHQCPASTPTAALSGQHKTTLMFGQAHTPSWCVRLMEATTRMHTLLGVCR